MARTEGEFLADCKATGWQDFDNAGGDDCPTVDELVADQAGAWARNGTGAEFGPEVQMRGLRAWAKAWVAACERSQRADALRVGDND